MDELLTQVDGLLANTIRLRAQNQALQHGLRGLKVVLTSLRCLLEAMAKIAA